MEEKVVTHTRLLSLTQTAERLNLCKRSVENLISSKQLRSVKILRRRLVRESDVESLIKKKMLAREEHRVVLRNAPRKMPKTIEKTTIRRTPTTNILNKQAYDDVERDYPNASDAEKYKLAQAVMLLRASGFSRQADGAYKAPTGE